MFPINESVCVCVGEYVPVCVRELFPANAKFNHNCLSYTSQYETILRMRWGVN